MSKTFKATAQMITLLTADIVADTQEEADAIAAEMDGCEFIEIEGSGSWNIDSVEEVVETEED